MISPAHFAPSSLPIDVKQTILDQNKGSRDLNHLIGKKHTDIDDINFAAMVEEIKNQDALKKIDIADYLPELWSLIRRSF